MYQLIFFQRTLSWAAGVMDPEAIARFRHFGSVEGVEESFGNSSLAGVFSQEYTQTIGKMQDLLFGIRNNDDTAEIDEAIENARSIALTSSPTDTHSRFIRRPPL
jgi:hypothetical protein